jgi:hypothetical protein
MHDSFQDGSKSCPRLKKSSNTNIVIDLCDSDDNNNTNNHNDDGVDIILLTSSNKQNEISSACSSSSTRRTSTAKQKSKPKYKIFCDLDGVLVDFETGAINLFKNRYTSTATIPPNVLWPRISSSKDFFRTLPWMNDGRQLWSMLLQQLEESNFKSLCILTGCPRNLSSRSQKFEWCKEHLDLWGEKNRDQQLEELESNMKLNFAHVDKAGKKSKHEIVSNHATGMKSITSMFQKKTNQKNNNISASKDMKAASIASKNTNSDPRVIKKKIDIITCWSKNKHYESNHNHVLIDDRLKFKEEWERKGGIFIYHINTKDTIQQMKKLEIISTSR